MPTVADLEKLNALINQLTPLTNVQRGELIEAASWNQLVSAVVEVARATLAERSVETVPEHQHPDQVALAWLDPRLRGLVLAGTQAEPAAQSKLSELSRKVDRVAGQLDALSDRIKKLAADVAGVETRDIERQSTVTDVSRRLEGVFDARGDVANLRSSLRTLEDDVRVAVELSRHVTDPSGQPIDFSNLATRIQGLEQLASDLTLSNGTTFTASAYDRDLQALRAELVTEGELTQALDGLRQFVEVDQRDLILEEARATTVSTIQSSLNGLSNQLQADFDRRFNTLEASIPDRINVAIADTETRLTAALRTERRDELEVRLATLTTDIEQAREARLVSFEQALLQTVGTRIDTLSADLDVRISDVLSSGLADVDSRLVAVETDVRSALTLSQANAADLKTTQTRMETMRRELQLADSELNTKLTDRITRLEGEINRRVADQVTLARSDLRTELQADLGVMRRDLETKLNDSIRKSVGTEVGLVTTRLRNDIGTITAAEVDTLRTDLEAQIAGSTNVSNARLSGLVADEVRRATAGVNDMVRREFEAYKPEITRQIDARLATRSTTPTRPTTSPRR